jgi:RimJ/RimL family protein N-acetyltransferase
MLKGDRVVLRAMRLDDLERYTEFQNDVESEILAGGEPPRPVSLGMVQAKLQESVLRKDEIWFAIDAGSRFIGQCILHEFNMTAHTCELGIAIGDKDYWGRGYGREAIDLLLKYAFRLLNMRRVWLRTSGSNLRAQRCFAACGFIEEGRLRKHIWTDNGFQDEVLMGVFRAEWEERLAREAGGQPSPSDPSAAT